jgi:ribosomal protein L37AE/L43A
MAKKLRKRNKMTGFSSSVRMDKKTSQRFSPVSAATEAQWVRNDLLRTPVCEFCGSTEQVDRIGNGYICYRCFMDNDSHAL